MKNREHIRVTGASGFVVSHLADKILKETSCRVSGLARSDESEQYLYEKFGKYGDRFSVVRGDIRDGLSPDPNIDMIIHGAANVQFKAPKEELARDNIQGVRNVLDFAKKCKNLKHFVHISTAYVNQIGNGPIMEGDFRPRTDFDGYHYEWSKVEGEKVVRDEMAKGLPFPVSILRPSIVIGHSTNGHTGGMNMTFNSYLSGIIKALVETQFDGDIPKFLSACDNKPSGPELELRMVGHKDTKKSFICVDEVANKMFYIINRQNPQNGIYHIVGAPIEGNHIAETLGTVLRFMKVDYVGESIPNPTRTERLVAKLTSPFRYYTLNSDNFDTSQADCVLKNSPGYKEIPMNPARFTSVIQTFADEARASMRKGLEK